MIASEIENKIDQLLHDAEHAEAGAKFAMMIGHTAQGGELAGKMERLIGEAVALDPQRKCKAWTRTSLSSKALALAAAPDGKAGPA